MVNRHQRKDDQPGYQTDPIYWEAIYRYLGWLGVACLIASWHAGPVMILVWIAVAWALTRDGGDQGGKPPNGKCNQTKGRRC